MIVGNKVDLSEDSDMRAVKTEDGEYLAKVSTHKIITMGSLWCKPLVWLPVVLFQSHRSMRKTKLRQCQFPEPAFLLVTAKKHRNPFYPTAINS